MIAGFVTVGLLGLAVVPFFDDDDEADDGDHLPEQAGPGVTHEVDGGRAGLVALDGFRPGVDRVMLDSPEEVETLETATGEDGAELRVGDTVLRFPGHEEVPVCDVWLADGCEVVPLSAVLEPVDPELPDAGGVPATDDVLGPVDPEEPDMPGAEEPGPVLLPVDPELPDQPDVGPDCDAESEPDGEEADASADRPHTADAERIDEHAAP
ncbi:hypothetical protein [Tranquillimonas alkanivorans]|uniref:Uncharacterized protein n=1 Tax=Tranquillimonas alkanivorans TaxID=441119 RepID=A0A1I5PGF1_9RHOB|nr:hypothetical protein [Tranquillimonas alkanivorans]SFP33198.1 hypothetical protein SAMN04488047_10597 [Tranquillimonas alkanivorans]